MDVHTLLHSIAELTGPIAWPLVALVASLFFRREVRDLLARLRKGGGAEFDPPPQAPVRPAEFSGAAVGSALSHATDSSVHAFESEATQRVKHSLMDLPLINSTASGPKREDLLISLLSRAVLVAKFEQIDGTIWKSQIELLLHLDATDASESPGRLKAHFYDKAASRYHELFANYSFEGYLGFLKNFGLIEVANGSLRISQEGKEYLAWRIEQSRGPKAAG